MNIIDKRTTSVERVVRIADSYLTVNIAAFGPLLAINTLRDPHPSSVSGRPSLVPGL